MSQNGYGRSAIGIGVPSAIGHPRCCYRVWLHFASGGAGRSSPVQALRFPALRSCGSWRSTPTSSFGRKPVITHPSAVIAFANCYPTAPRLCFAGKAQARTNIPCSTTSYNFVSTIVSVWVIPWHPLGLHLLQLRHTWASPGARVTSQIRHSGAHLGNCVHTAAGCLCLNARNAAPSTRVIACDPASNNSLIWRDASSRNLGHNDLLRGFAPPRARVSVPARGANIGPWRGRRKSDKLGAHLSRWGRHPSRLWLMAALQRMCARAASPSRRPPWAPIRCGPLHKRPPQSTCRRPQAQTRWALCSKMHECPKDCFSSSSWRPMCSHGSGAQLLIQTS